MKKIIGLIIVFAILSVGVTAGLIFHRKNQASRLNLQSGEKEMNSSHVSNNKENISSEKTIDLYGTYCENDLIIETKELWIDEISQGFHVPYIIGLKNKKIEEKINSEIEEKIIQEMIEHAKRQDITDLNFHFNDYTVANFSNVLSINCSVFYKFNDIYQNDDISFNYELVHGQSIKFEDLFRKNEDLSTIARIALYKYLAEMENSYMEMEYEEQPYYDAEKNGWYVLFHGYDFETDKSYEEIREYVSPMTDYDIEKKIQKFIKNNDKNFYFSPSRLWVQIDEIVCSLDFKDIADKVVIYNKYLTNDSLYERKDIGAKSVVTCSAERNLGPYKETKFESDNFFYDMDVIVGEGYSLDDGYPARKYLNQKMEEEALKVKAKVEEYKKIADANKDKAYFLFVQSDITFGSHYEYTSSTTTYNNLLTTELGTKLITCDINEKQNVLDGILSNYRYYNLLFYRNIYFVTDGNTYLADYSEKYPRIPAQENIERHTYNVLNGKEITSIQDIFKDGVNYEEVIQNAIINNNEKYNSYELYAGYIKAKGSDEDGYRIIDLDDIKEYLNIKELKPDIFPSSIIQIEQSELDSLSKDELWLAYNEIFARHGHDFKNKEFQYYFNLWDWYQPISGKVVSLDELSDVEKENVTLIKRNIDERE